MGSSPVCFFQALALTAEIEQISRTNILTGKSIYILQSQQDEIGRISRALGQMVEFISEAFSRSETQIQERTASLQRRSVQLDVASQVAREIAAARDLETLLYQAVNAIRDQFSFYHAGIFLIDFGGEYAILRAATGQAGQEMLARGHRLKIGEVGVVGHVAQTGEPRVATDVSQDQVHFKNPLLPETRSEAALPLKSAGKVIGILDVQSTEPDAFDSESMSTFQLMSDQLTVAIQNTRLFEESQKNFEKLRSTYGVINRQAWDQMLQTTRLTGFEYDGLEARPIYKSLSPGKAEKDSEHIQDKKPVQVSINARGDQIGELNIWPDQTEISETDLQLINRICNRLGQTLETARLFENAQRLAARAANQPDNF